MKKWIAIVFVLLMVLPLAACKKTKPSTAADTPTEKSESVPEFVPEGYDQGGTCGADARWMFKEDTGKLTITGTGAMANYEYQYDDKTQRSYSTAPWGQLDVTSVTIDGVTTIGDNAFSYCGSLTSITIGDSVTTIGERAFLNCYSLTAITIGNSVTTIGGWAFSYCYSLMKLTIGDSVTAIDYRAFYDCDNLTAITIPGNVTSIGSLAFSDCDALTEITIGNGTTAIWAGAFSACDNLTKITIPTSVTAIFTNALNQCNNLSDIYYQGTQTQWDKIKIIGYSNELLITANIHYNS